MSETVSETVSDSVSVCVSALSFLKSQDGLEMAELAVAGQGDDEGMSVLDEGALLTEIPIIVSYQSPTYNEIFDFNGTDVPGRPLLTTNFNGNFNFHLNSCQSIQIIVIPNKIRGRSLNVFHIFVTVNETGSAMYIEIESESKFIHRIIHT